MEVLDQATGTAVSIGDMLRLDVIAVEGRGGTVVSVDAPTDIEVEWTEDRFSVPRIAGSLDVGDYQVTVSDDEPGDGHRVRVLVPHRAATDIRLRLADDRDVLATIRDRDDADPAPHLLIIHIERAAVLGMEILTGESTLRA